MSTAVEQCNEGFTAIQQFFLDLSQYISDGITLPDEETLHDALPFEEILTYTTNNSLTSADYSIGAGVETVQHFVAVDREISMADTGKTAIYISAISESDREAEFYAQNAAFFSGVIRGAPTTGSQC